MSAKGAQGLLLCDLRAFPFASFAFKFSPLTEEIQAAKSLLMTMLVVPGVAGGFREPVLFKRRCLTFCA